MVSSKPNANGGVRKPSLSTHQDRRKISLIIPAYYANEDLKKMTMDCIASAGEVDELILQVDPIGEGYSKTVNKALRAATGDILVIGNNDLVFPEGWLEELLWPLDEGYDIATCWTSDQDYYLAEDTIEEGAKFGSLFAMTRQVYETLGGFDEQFKGYFADLDYRSRAIAAGAGIGKNLGLVVEHQAKATYKVTDPDDNEYLRAMRLYEAKWGFIE